MGGTQGLGKAADKRITLAISTRTISTDNTGQKHDKNVERVACTAGSTGVVPAHPVVLNVKEKRSLANFSAHGLNDLNKAALMDRVDTKFVIPRSYLSDLLDAMHGKYSVLQIDDLRASRYHNEYYDTANYVHYMAHHNRLANRFKLRQRTYADSGTSFIEIKFRNNHGRTIKTRIQVSAEQKFLDERTQSFIRESGIARFGPLEPVQIGTYERIALANEAEAERITIDLNLAFEDNYTGNRHAIGDWVVVEVKQNEFNRHAPFFVWARERGLRKCSFSKYCMGIYHTGPADLKRNNFHKVARHLAVAKKRCSRLQSSRQGRSIESSALGFRA